HCPTTAPLVCTPSSITSSLSSVPPRLLSLFSFIPRPPPTSTLFPYTTLFRSFRGSRPFCPLARAWTTPGDMAHRPPLPASHTFRDRKSTRLNSSHLGISYAVFCLKKKKNNNK